MFEVTGDDILQLGDADLQTLVARLALAELAAGGAPCSAVTAGGHQDAKDGGIDVRVDLVHLHKAADFVPRANTGFQVKKPDMPRNEIIKEMRPGGTLRPAIAALADAGGAYIIVSAQGSLAGPALTERRQAMRDALSGHPTADDLLTDFYDRDRLANWVNLYPGAAAWVRDRIGRPLSGWRPIGRWSDTGIAPDRGYLVSDRACLIDERAQERDPLPIREGIERLRAVLAVPGQCVRLIGLSGLGKTRLVEALFEHGVGATPLDPALSVYTDYAEDITPPAGEMARRLVDSGRRAILIVDNCNPATHGQLTKTCSAVGSPVSLLTVEYDVKDDEPENTEVFRLTGVGRSLVETWLERDFSHVSSVDRPRIAAFSDGNFRVARVLAGTVERGETLGQLRDQDLFDRIFRQRNEADRPLRQDAEVLALLYSFDGEDCGAEGELARLAAFAGRTVDDLYASVNELRDRGVIQSRGRWRAVLPQAIANPLAAGMLRRKAPPSFDTFCAALPPRMRTSLTRRLGYLHDSAEAQTIVSRWLRPDGALGDLFGSDDGMAIIHNLAPVAPEAVLERIAAELAGPRGAAIISPGNWSRGRWISLLKALAYEPALFDRAAIMLAGFVGVELEQQTSNSAARPITELFHLYLSGTQATPAQRRALVRDLFEGGLHRAASLALDGLFETDNFIAFSHSDFGARPRDEGWHPKINGDIIDWYHGAISLTVDLADRHPEVRQILAGNLRGLWSRIWPCHDLLEQASLRFATTGGWIEGWKACCDTLHFHGADMPDEARARLQVLIDHLKPVDLIERARAFVLKRFGRDVADGKNDSNAVGAWTRGAQTAVNIGAALAADRERLAGFLPEVVRPHPDGCVHDFGRGLAQGAEDLDALWTDLVSAYRAAPEEERNLTVLGGFLAEAHRISPDFCGPVLDRTLDNPDLARKLPYLQAQAGLDAEGLARLEGAARRQGMLQAGDFWFLATGVIADAPAEPLAALLEVIGKLDGGVAVVMDILHISFYVARNQGQAVPDRLRLLGRDLLQLVDWSGIQRMHYVAEMIEVLLAGPDGADEARRVCTTIQNAKPSASRIGDVCTALFKVQPHVALECFDPDGKYFRTARELDAETLCVWADQAPAERYPQLGRVLPLFPQEHGEEAEALSPLFLAVMAKAPDKVRFLAADPWRCYPSGGWGSLADALEKRKALLDALAADPDPGVRTWVREEREALDRSIAEERKREAQREERFE